MKRFVILLLVCTANAVPNFAEGLKGEYFITSAGGEIKLVLTAPDQQSISGTMTDEQGVQYILQGETSDNKSVSGILSLPQGGSIYFQASLSSAGLDFYLIPAGADQQPDYNNASQYAFQKRIGPSSAIQPPPAAIPSGPLRGQTNSSGAWNGKYTGSINGTQSILTLRQNGSNVEGNIDASGYVYNLKGTVNGNQSTGQLVDSNTQGVMNYSGTSSGRQISLNLEVPGQYGQTTQLQLTFTRDGGTFQPSHSNPADQPSSRGDSNVSHDQRLVGGWRYTDTYVSGEFSAVSEWYLQINPDGTYRYGDGQVAGGDSGGFFESGGGSGASTGQWKTENGVVYINEGYGWQPYATYIVDSNSMLFKFDDGSKQLYNRYR
jgi:hypothetical protein